jgi:hypothetical protein
VVTLDSLIDSHGVPSYCKIDVEGFEPQALRGLSYPIATIDFEFHRELAEAIEDCLERLADLGDYRYRTFIGEWPEVRGGELARGAVPPAIASFEPGTWGMIRASFP